jgi:hypothetical protein
VRAAAGSSNAVHTHTRETKGLGGFRQNRNRGANHFGGAGWRTGRLVNVVSLRKQRGTRVTICTAQQVQV